MLHQACALPASGLVPTAWIWPHCVCPRQQLPTRPMCALPRTHVPGRCMGLSAPASPELCESEAEPTKQSELCSPGPKCTPPRATSGNPANGHTGSGNTSTATIANRHLLRETYPGLRQRRGISVQRVNWTNQLSDFGVPPDSRLHICNTEKATHTTSECGLNH